MCIIKIPAELSTVRRVFPVLESTALICRTGATGNKIPTDMHDDRHQIMWSSNIQYRGNSAPELRTIKSGQLGKYCVIKNE